MIVVRATFAHVLLLTIAGSTVADDRAFWSDPRGDASARRMDAGADGAIGPAAVLPDILTLVVGNWQPTSPATDLYAGTFGGAANFFRIDIEFDGLIGPPGPLGVVDVYDPFQFGPSPLYGYIELDVDGRKDTGGELGGAAATRFLASVARFGCVPTGSIGERAARQGADLDFSFTSSPQYERSGADFALTFCGCSPATLVSQSGNGNGTFESGETWVVQGRFLERFTAFNTASSMFGGSTFGAWNPLVQVRFRHDAELDTTMVTLVYPLNQTGAGQLVGAAPQSFDFNVANQTSIAEALNELVNQPSWISGPLRTLSIDWKGRDVADGLDTQKWGITAIAGTAYVDPDDFPFVWTDTGFGLTAADFNGDGDSNSTDEAELNAFLASNDGGPADADGAVDGVVTIADFGINFSVYDTNYDGVVDAQDWPEGHPADVNGDGVVDIMDFLDFIEAFSACENLSGPCIMNGVDGDFNHDGWVDILDFLDFLQAFDE